MDKILFEIKFINFNFPANMVGLRPLYSILTGQHITYPIIKIIMPNQPYVFSQFLRLIPRYDFQSIVNKYNGDYRIKHFKCWDQLACMTLAHIRQEDSLRDIDITLNAHASKLYHIGIKQCPKSTLADANERRDYRIYEEFAKTMMHRARREYAQTELALEVDNAVYALDASTIDLTLYLCSLGQNSAKPKEPLRCMPCLI